MNKKIFNLYNFFIVASIIGAIGGTYIFNLYQKPPHTSKSPPPPSDSPFEDFIIGTGVIEPASENIKVGAMVGSTVNQVFVKKGQAVLKGQPLFNLNAQQAAADLIAKKTIVKVAITALGQAEAALKFAEDELSLVNQLKDKRGVTKEEIITRQNNALSAQKGVENARANIIATEAQVAESKVILDSYTITAPIDGEIIQINIHPGEYAPAEILSTPLMVMGDVSRYHIRIDIEEKNAWRLKKEAPAVAIIPGNPKSHVNLKFEYIEPAITSVSSLKGDDMRALQVVYSYDPKVAHTFLGQAVKVYIQVEKTAPSAKDPVSQ
ncbi:MAG: efflux RND transporter periplasmic adaptor subunit [Alphaproteobacteria bacterium]|nr:efflux RND transporter periplasmic adaptor subunit [Alphaproteobacteria bacterium]